MPKNIIDGFIFLMIIIATGVINFIVTLSMKKIQIIFTRKKTVIRKISLNFLLASRYFLPILLIIWGTMSKNIPFDKWFVISISFGFMSFCLAVFFDFMLKIIANQREIIRTLAPGG